jgi:F-type H+-transporting ATPase subunit b
MSPVLATQNKRGLHVEKLGIDVRWFISQLVNFIILLLILQRFLYKPVLNMLQQRQERIRESMDYAERVKKEAARAQEDYGKKIEESRHEAQAIIAQATQQAERSREGILAKAQEEAKEIKAKAITDVEYERKRVMAELRDQVADLAILAASRVLGKELDAKTHRQVVADFLNESGKLN